MLTPSFYGCKKRKRNPSADTPQATDDDNVTDPARLERLNIIEREVHDVPCKGMRIVNISKTYRKYPFKIKSKKDIHAVKNVYLEVRNNELLALLGHNGAGKSTLIGVLTGLLHPDSGTANINSFDLRSDLFQIRRNLGYCPQFDLLWGELTAREHLTLFARLKGVSIDKLKDEVEERLNDVNLKDVGDHRVDTFSGGMKRRLSVAISGIGNPGVIILDEPTTGMDPISRRQVWEYIRKLKKGRVIILTTHSMEEADVLSDRVAVIVDGNIRCLGTSLYLKNRFGDGYRISITTKDPQMTSNKLQDLLPRARFLDESAGSLVYSVPFECVREIGMLVEELEENRKDWVEVDDWSISHTTLEEVFMRVTGKKESRREEMQANS
jgi:ABC-type multidrug transport system ATPase subunit